MEDAIKNIYGQFLCTDADSETKITVKIDKENSTEKEFIYPLPADPSLVIHSIFVNMDSKNHSRSRPNIFLYCDDHIVEIYHYWNCWRSIFSNELPLFMCTIKNHENVYIKIVDSAQVYEIERVIIGVSNTVSEAQQKII